MTFGMGILGGLGAFGVRFGCVMGMGGVIGCRVGGGGRFGWLNEGAVSCGNDGELDRGWAAWLS